MAFITVSPALCNSLTLLGVLALAGALGGLVRAIIENAHTENVITLPFSRRSVALGWLGDALVGACAAIVGFTFFNVLETAETTKIAEHLVKFAGFGIAAGYAGARILNAMLDKFPERKLGQLEAKQEALRLHNSGKYSQAARKYREILQDDPTDLQTQVSLALSLSYTGPDGETEALKLLDDVVKADPKADEAWYNLACIRAVHQPTPPGRLYTDKEVLEALGKAIELDPSWKTYVLKDVDFNRFRTTPAHAAYAALTGDTAGRPLA